MKIWRSNKNADFSGVVDNTKIFEFVSGIYDESEQWIYTFDSVRDIREDLKDFFEENYGFQTILSEFDSFPVDPCKGTFENCIENVDKTADIFVLIVGNRYGYVMENGKSITNLEYLHANLL